jgi:hypothetical protein
VTDVRDGAREAAIAYLREHRITPGLRAADARRQRVLFLVGVALASVLVAAVTTALVVLPGGSRPPVLADPTPVELAPHAEPTATAVPVSEMHIVQVGADLIASPRDVNEVPRIAVPDEPLEATHLGAREDGREAIGVLTAAGRVCLWVYDAPAQQDRVQCVPYEVFQEDGVVVDRGGWEVHWTADGSVAWSGL